MSDEKNPPVAEPAANRLAWRTPADRAVRPALPQSVSIGVGVVAAAVGYYLRFTMLVPVALMALPACALKAILPAPSQPIMPAAAVQIGQGLWMLVGMIILNRYDLALADVIILAAGVVWLTWQPGIVSAGLLACYQVFGLGVNVLALDQSVVHSAEFKGLLMHILIRIVALITMAIGVLQIRQNQGAEGVEAAMADIDTATLR